MQFSVSNKQILSIAAPIAIAQLMPQISFMANAAFLARLGNNELVINGISGIFYLLLSWIGFGLSNGSMVLLSRRAGENDLTSFTKTFANSIFMVILFAFVLIGLSSWIAPIIFKASLNNEHIYIETVKFLQWRMWGLPFLLLSQIFNVFFIATGKSKLLILGALSSNAIVVLLDYGLIFGHFNLPALGLYGAAIASITGEVVYFLTMFGLFMLHKFYIQYPIFKNFKPDWNIIKNTLLVASPLVVQYVFSIGGWQLFYIYVEHLGINEVGASHIIRSVLGIISVGTWALASTCNTMVSNILGQNRSQFVIPTVKKIIKLGLVYIGVICIFIFVFPQQVLSIYTDDAKIIELAIPSIRVLCVSSIVMVVATCCFNAVVGTGKTWINLSIEITCVIIYIVFITVVVEYMRAPLYIAWSSEFIYWSSLLILAGSYLYSNNWKGKKI